MFLTTTNFIKFRDKTCKERYKQTYHSRNNASYKCRSNTAYGNSFRWCVYAVKFLRMISKYQDNPEALKQAGIAYAVDQIIDLLSNDIDGIHLYTMNKPETAQKS